ncbi:MAG: antibiotic biosynthesis monooxygenase [Ignavibacteriae bacterium]|nr:antibiotic biosynthesis monooxygenase [Ignavibacteria bacterium]MBI3363853.1 antibiotic biosynthesis monooxygenase [Ignavibacteriota bacterium]
MYMRFVHVKIKPEVMFDLSRLYDEKVIPVLHNTPGCLYAILSQGVHHNDECISMTLWETPQHAEAYERSGVFRALLQEAEPYLADASEWKIHLSNDLTLRYEPVREEPVVDTYAISSQKNDEFLSRKQAGGLYVRIVSPQLREGKLEEFKKLYTEELLPRLRTMHGCRYAAIIENVQEPEKIISISIWDSKQDADAYEINGMFDELTNKVRHTFSEIYQWKMQLERETGRQVVTSEEMTVEGYSIVTGKSFV